MTKVFDAYAAYYDLLYQDKNYLTEAEHVASLIRTHIPACSRILELGCGTGEHALHLANMGYQIHGIDSSKAMVSRAQSKVPSNLVDKIAFEQGDLRDFRSLAAFDAVISLFHVASYQTANADISKMFATAARHLGRGGVFIFDFWYGPAVLHQKPEVRIKRYDNDTCQVLRVAEPNLHTDEDVVEVDYTVLVSDPRTSATTRIVEKHRMRYFFLPELAAFLESSDLTIGSAVEWITGRSLGLDTWNALIVAIKR